MKKAQITLSCFLFACILLFLSFAEASFSFSDTRFQNDLSTENLDAIIEEYELYDGWYWTTRADIVQDFHGHPESPGWNSSIDISHKKNFLAGWYGCRWPIDKVRKTSPDHGGYAECFAFAQFVGYLLSGDINPQHHWKFYYSVEDSQGLRVGDIVRVEYKKKNREYHHSAVVYAINGDEILYLQVSGGNYNMISVGKGFSDGNLQDASTLDEIASLPGLKISRYYIPE